MIAAISRILAWAARNERHLGGFAFVFGFITDLFTFTLLSAEHVTIVLSGFLALATTAVLVSSAIPRSRHYTKLHFRALSIGAPLAAQYAIGGMLSGFAIFYTKNADLSASWPFLVLLAAVFIGNEFFRLQYKYLAFQLGLLYFALYGYFIFTLPLYIGRLGPDVFLLSTFASLLAFALFLSVLRRINRPELLRSLKYLLPGALATLILIQVAYFTGVLPPIPLAMSESGIHHSLQKKDGNYVVMTEQDAHWYEFYKGVEVHTPLNTTLYAFSAVSSPVHFSARVIHRLERYNNSSRKWVTISKISFPVSGGRSGGYRGYSEFTPTAPGKWRVSVETPGGQVIGRIPFTLVVSATSPVLHEETH